MSGISIRKIEKGEEAAVANILHEAHGNFLDPRPINILDLRPIYQTIASEHVNQQHFLIAEEDQLPIGCIAITTLPRPDWYVLRHLAVNHQASSRENVAEKLLGEALGHTRSRRAKYVRATTPTIQPYIHVYKHLGFIPVRRDFRIAWNFPELPDNRSCSLRLERVSDGSTKAASELFVRSLTPYWDWRTEEQGGPAAFEHSLLEGIKNGEHWFLAYATSDLVGLAGLIPDFYGKGQARFRGAYVAPERRGKGLGLDLLHQVIEKAKELQQHRMVVYTFSYLDALAPGALLYLRSGGTIESEYIQLQQEMHS